MSKASVYSTNPPTPPESFANLAKFNHKLGMEDDATDTISSSLSPPKTKDSAEDKQIKEVSLDDCYHFYNGTNNTQRISMLKTAWSDIGAYLKDIESRRSVRKLSKVDSRARNGYDSLVSLDAFDVRLVPKSSTQISSALETKSNFVRHEKIRWQRLVSGIQKLYPNNIGNADRICPWIPRSEKTYLRHVKEVCKAEFGYLEHKLKSSRDSRQVPAGALFNGKSFGNPFSIANPTNFSPVLCMETIWVAVPWVPVAPYPSMAEFEWEGFSRIQTEKGNFKRMLPIPRVPPGVEGYHEDYKECHPLPAFPFDDMYPVPDYESIYHPPDEIEDPKIIAQLLPRGLLDQIDRPVY